MCVVGWGGAVCHCLRCTLHGGLSAPTETGISLQHSRCEHRLQSQLVQGRQTTQLPFPHLSGHADTRKPSGRTAPLDQSKSEQDFTLTDSSTIKACHIGRKTRGATLDKGIQGSQQFSLPKNLVLKP